MAVQRARKLSTFSEKLREKNGPQAHEWIIDMETE